MGAFVDLITTVAEVAPERPDLLEQVIGALRVLLYPSADWSWEPQQYLDFFAELRELCLTLRTG